MDGTNDGFLRNESRNRGEESILRSNLFLDHFGEVVVTLNSDGLSWKLLEAANNKMDRSSCWVTSHGSKIENAIKFSDIYAVEFINWCLIHESILPKSGGFPVGHDSEMFCFMVHGFQRSKTQRSLWILTTYTFGHKDLQICQTWVNQINASMEEMQADRPKSLLVFIHPLSGKRNGCRTWETVAPIFSRANVKTKVTVTERAGHAFDVISSMKDEELKSHDGVVAIGGDGFFNEILNGLLSPRYKASYPPAPTDFVHTAENTESNLVHHPNETTSKSSHQNEPLLSNSGPNSSGFSNIRSEDQDTILSFPNEKFRLGIIPAGSTDAIVICTTGTRDPITSALHIVLGKRVRLDIAQVVRWKTSILSKDAPSVRYAASFAGYGFYGDVIKESEKYRWMGPKRYDYAGTKVFLQHRSYGADIRFLEVKAENVNAIPVKGLQGRGTRSLWGPQKRPERLVCHVNCSVCTESVNPTQMITKSPTETDYMIPKDSRWLQSKGHFLSVGAAVISCRNERAPDGLVADAHLADGFLHLILVKECPRAFYLWHLTQLAKKDGSPLNFKFVEHHKTPAFTFMSFGDESVWNLDGELFQAHQLSAQVLRGLVSLFASGPEV
ncbi:ceramide kinase isoform X2 [Macadamia integrifolia]|uniref:ceramide kinase isoform X2 n=1 Tax=Macadamia integrifolia TaxID=60698 RepID=UPI001C4F11BD|nr:ceramide kinase isoform X2 [Macadamia integrifolia]